MARSLYTALASFTRDIWRGAEPGDFVNESAKAEQAGERQPVGEGDAAGDNIPLPDEPKGWRKTPKGSFPKSEAVARRHIEQTRAWNQAADQRGVGKMLHNYLLKFLYELLQNADDNHYGNRKPTLKITYTEDVNGKTLRIDSNEIGFSAEDIHAICSLAEDNKLGDPDRIGENGLGFKSVFSFSSSVSIHSGFYSFKLVNEKMEKLGSVTPVWEEFPQPTLPEHTSILLRLFLEPESNARELTAMLKSLGSALLFLRKLEEVNIAVLEKDAKPWKTSLKRRIKPLGKDISKHEVLKDGAQHISYNVFRQEVAELGHDDRRSGRDKSDLLLAFPTGEPKPEHLYTFLPVGDFGLQFIIQADFVLSPNRQGMMSSPWNKALIAKVPEVFLRAVTHFNEGDSRYSWLPFVPFKTPLDTPLWELPFSIITALKGSRVLESEDGKFYCPSELVYVPSRFRGSDGELLFPVESANAKFLSNKYPHGHAELLRRLNVVTMSMENFVDELSFFINRRQAEFQSKPAAWHERVCRILSSSMSKPLLDRISQLAIIPLTGVDTWIAPSGANIYFSPTGKEPHIPKGLGIFQVSTDVAAGSPDSLARMSLFNCLGVKLYDSRAICKAIISTHASPGFAPASLSIEDVVSHLVFLKAAGWESSSLRPNLWVASTDSSRCRTHSVYLDLDSNIDPLGATTVLKPRRSQLHFLHERYEAELTRYGDDWRQWLVSQFGVAQLPRLVQETGSGFTISNDFRWLGDADPQTALRLLRDRWGHYRMWIVPTENESQAFQAALALSRATVRHALSHMRVPCRGGDNALLGKTFLPRKSVLVGLDLRHGNGDSTLTPTSAMGTPSSPDSDPTADRLTSLPSMPTAEEGSLAGQETGDVSHPRHSYELLDVPDPENLRWNFLQALGVITKLEVAVFLHRLRQLKEKDTEASQAEVASLYELIGKRCDEQEGAEESMAKVRDTFKAERLVYIPSSNDKSGWRWSSVATCVWAGPSFLRNVCRLHDHYPTLSRLFNGILGCPDITTSHAMALAYLVQEAQGITQNDDLEYIERVFMAIADQVRHGVRKGSDSDAVCGLRDQQIFPTRRGFERTSPSYQLRSASQTEEWYIPDDPEAAPVFANKLDYLAFPQSDFDRLSPLFELLGVQDRRLSLAASSQIVPEGEVRPGGADCASLLKRRMHFIVALVPRTIPDRDELQRRLYGLEAFEADALRASWTISRRGSASTAHGTARPRLAFSVEDSKLKLFIAAQGSDPANMTFDLASELTKLCQIKASEHSILLMLVLTQTEEKSIENAFQYRGLSFDIAVASSAISDKAHTDQSNGGGRELPRHTPGDDAREESRPSSATDQAQEVEIKKKSSRVIGPPGNELVDTKQGTPVQSSADQHDGAHLPSSVISKPAKFPEKSDPNPQPRRPTEFVNMRSGMIKVAEPKTLFFGDAKDDEVDFYGELYVSWFLQRLLGKEYDATKHWTSRLRTRDGLGELRLEPGSSSFTIPEEQGGKLSNLLISKAIVRENQLRFPCTFHIQVCSTRHGLVSSFGLVGSQLEKWKSLALDKNQESNNVCILARAYDVYSDEPGIALYTDPWKVQHMLDLRSSVYMGTVLESLPADITEKAVEVDDSETPKIYQGLNVGASRIRLLQLSSSSNDDQLVGTLSRRLVELSGGFWAISYVWGPKGGGFTFATDQGSIPITESLATCLKTLRREGVKKPIWADAVCINQNKKLEKAMQVRRMGSLYERASKIIIWMGRGDNADNTSTAIQLLTALHANQCYTCKEKHDGRAIISSQERDFGLRAAALDALDQNPIIQFLHRKWFGRAWIIQELILGSLSGSEVIVKHGHSEIQWDCFIASLVEYEKLLIGIDPYHPSALSGKLYLPNAPAVIALERTRREYKSGVRKPFLELLERFAYAESSQRRDKLFALLNLASDWPAGKMPKEFWPDYQSSDEEVLVNYARGFVQPGWRMKVLDLLYRAGGDKSCRFCTWIPDLMDEKGKARYPPTISTWEAAGSGEANDHMFRACGPMATVASIKPADNQTPVADGGFQGPVLAIAGYVVDAVNGLQPLRIGYSAFDTSTITFMDAWEDILTYTKNMSTYPGRSPSDGWKRELLVKLLIGDARGPCIPNLDFKLHAWDERQWRETKLESYPWPDNLEEELFSLEAGQHARKYVERSTESQDLLTKYWLTAKAFTDLIDGATYCITQGSYVGIVPGATKAGDKIFIPHGAAVPFIIRPDGETGYHKLIGECYIHGLMYYKQSHKGGWKEQEILLV
ncbi:hypothetical protein MFIFM68171_09876 [Madurella fahalii]|uniref:Heterokaryon incompatibility domain-containing protein n=1 Tax=Madurella fahalii TaxID=1157608 RepID=A0ABQ0GPJ7_9PEZI